MQLADGSAASIISAFDSGGVDQVFNFEVEDFHTYYVGQQRVWVHDIDCAAVSAAPTGVRANQLAGASREALVRSELAAKYLGATIQNEVYLRTANGKRAIDPFSGEARRIDAVVIQNRRVVDSVEVTSLTANKDAQFLKEMNIRNNGGTFIRDRATGQLLDISQIPIVTVRKT